MPEVVRHKTYQMRDFRGIDEESFWMDINWQRDKKDMSNNIINPFKASVIAAKPHSVDEFCDEGVADDERPKRLEEHLLIGGVYFEVKSQKAVGRTTVDLVQDFMNYLSILKQRKLQEEVAEKGLRTIGGELYVSVNMLIDKIESQQAQAKGTPYVKQTLNVIPLAGIPESLVRNVNRDYSQLTEQNAEIYERAVKFVEEYERRDKDFRRELFADSCDILGYEPNAEESIAIVGYPYGALVFEHQIEFRQEASPAKIVETLIKPMPRTLTRVSNVGELVMAREYPERKEEIEAKELVDKFHLGEYNPMAKGQQVYVRLQAVENRLNEIMAEKTGSHYEQNIWVRKEL